MLYKFAKYFMERYCIPNIHAENQQVDITKCKWEATYFLFYMWIVLVRILIFRL